MAAVETIQDTIKLLFHGAGVEPKNTFDNVIGAIEVGGIVVSRFLGGLEIPKDHPRRTRVQGQRLTLKTMRQEF